MKKITNFIVNKRIPVIIFFIISTIVLFFVSKNVNINYDMAEYLPNTSDTRQGMNIMEENFKEIKSSSLNVMFKGLKEKEKEQIKKELQNIKNVEEVIYDETEEYNKDDYSLYVVNVSDNQKSDIAKKVYNNINEIYEDYDIYYSGPIHNSNLEVIDFSIVVLAVFCAFIILVIMSNSYIEPVLILFVILLAVVLNRGTNIMFSSVSHITNAICAILQMALSMDYSIMLINRYRQEREIEANKIEAMKKALYHAFKSISSSSVTTVVGLLALAFMSFSIGADLGFVLAKGVFLSLVSIFFCLPGLLIIFDTLIRKTKKKSLVIKLGFLNKFSYKVRYVFTILFITIFVISYIFKGSLGIFYTGSENNEIKNHFNENNQIAVIYNNKYESAISEYCNTLDDEKIKETLCYGNTINNKLKYNELNEQIATLGSNISIEDYLLQILYYNKFNNSNSIEISYNDLITFIENKVYQNKDLEKNIDNNIKDGINKLKNFTNKDLMNKKLTSNEIASVLDMDSKNIDNILMLYNSQNISIKITLPDFINYLNNTIINDKTYGSSFNEEQKELLNKLSIFTDKKIINKEMNSKELSNIFGIDEKLLNELLLMNHLNDNNKNKISISDFILTVNNIKTTTNYLDDIDLSSLDKLVILAKNENNINGTKLNKIYLKEYFKNINPVLVDTVYTYASLEDNYTMTPGEFITFTLTNFSTVLNENDINNLKLLNIIIESTISEEKTTYSVDEISMILQIDKINVNKLYNLIDYINGKSYKISSKNLVELILNNTELAEIKSNITKEDIETLNLLNTIMDSVIKNKLYSTNDMVNLLNIPKDKIELLYSVYDINILKHNVNISLYDFVNYILNNLVTNKDYANLFTTDKINKLNMLSNIMNSSINNKKINLNNAYNNLSKLSDKLDRKLLELVYIYYGSINYYDDNYTLTVEEFINYLNNDIINNELFVDFIDQDMKNGIIKAKKDIEEAKELLVSDNYSRFILNTIYKEESEESFKFVETLRNDLKKYGDDIYVIGDTPMAYDMSLSFDSELNLITILTMLFIFLVVAITFKSIIIPSILVLVIQCAVFLTMCILSISGENIYFIAILIVQSILMGATIDYAIVYTSYYLEARKDNDKLTSIKLAYDNSIHTIVTSSSILIIVTLIVGHFATNIAAKICITLSKGTLCSVLLILIMLPSILACFDKVITRKLSKK